MSNKNLKVTFLHGGKKLSFYLREREDTFGGLHEQIKNYLVNERKFPNAEFRLYWIDSDGDEIEIVSQSDLLVFIDTSGAKCHLYVSSLTEDHDSVTQEQQTTSNAQGNNTGFLHKSVECDGCKVPEIRGFRYKCLQCANFDLCQNCESKQVHKEHIMLRMPDDTFRDDILAFTGGFDYVHRSRGKHSHKRGAVGCPFLMRPQVFTATATTATQANQNTSTPSSSAASTPVGSTDQSANSGEEAKRGDHSSRKRNKQHQRPRCPANGLSKLFGMLNDLAGNGEPFSPQIEVQVAANDVATQANIAATAAATAAVHAAQAAVQKIASSASSSILNSLNNVSNSSSETPINPTNNNNNSNRNNNQNNDPNENSGINNNNDGTHTNRNDNNNNNNNNNVGTNTPIVGATGLENIGQYIDPQYMKQGIQILTNFSDLFGKMLDTMETTDSNDASPNTSTISSTTHNAETEAAKKKQEQQKPPHEEQMRETPISLEVNPIEVMDLTERRSPSIDGDWQMIEGQQQRQQLQQQVSVTSTPDLISANSSGSVNYQQLSNDLHAHLQLEESNTSATNENAENAAAAAAAATTTAATPAAVDNNADRRFVPVYHADQSINQSVIAMMAMGFSNENSWLTQLLESVNGNISAALDLMTVAQRGQQ